MATTLTIEVYDALKSHLIMMGGNDCTPEQNIYDCWAPVEIKSILEEAHVGHSVYIHNTDNDYPAAADKWCSVTWDSAGSMTTIGFNYMSETRMDEFTKFEKHIKEQANEEQ